MIFGFGLKFVHQRFYRLANISEITVHILYGVIININSYKCNRKSEKISTFRKLIDKINDKSMNYPSNCFDYLKLGKFIYEYEYFLKQFSNMPEDAAEIIRNK